MFQEHQRKEMVATSCSQCIENEMNRSLSEREMRRTLQRPSPEAERWSAGVACGSSWLRNQCVENEPDGDDDGEEVDEEDVHAPDGVFVVAHAGGAVDA